MEIKIVEEKHPSHLTGGAYSYDNLTVIINPDLPYPEKVECVIHEVLENYLSCLSHEKVVELTDLIIDAVEQIKDDCETSC